MDADEAREFLRTHHHGVLATFRQDGRPAMSPVAAAVDDAGRVIVSTRETAMKVKHLRRDPRVAFTGFVDEFFGPWVQVEGTAEVVELPAAMDLLVDYYRRVAGEHDDWDDYRVAMAREQRVLIRFAIDRAGPTRAADPVRCFHVTSARNRRSIEQHGLDWTRMGAAYGIAGSRAPEVEGVFVCRDRDEADWFLNFDNGHGPFDVWAVDGVDGEALLDNGSGYAYLPARVGPEQLSLVARDVEPRSPAAAD